MWPFRKDTLVILKDMRVIVLIAKSQQTVKSPETRPGSRGKLEEKRSRIAIDESDLTSHSSAYGNGNDCVALLIPNETPGQEDI